MAIIPQLSILESQNATLLSIYDDTSGFGSPNPDSTAMTSATQVYSFDKITGTTILNFVILLNVIQSVTKTDTLGNVTNLDLAEYNFVNFPNTSATPWEFPASFFGVSNTFADQYLTVTYTLGDGSETWTNATMFLLDQASCCCSQKAIARFADNDCKDTFPTRIVNALYGLKYQNAVGNYVAARKTITQLEKLCQDCGCGCGGNNS
jgi:hypothetical protein